MNTLPGEFEVWMMCHNPREYAAQILLESRDALRMSLDEGQQLGAGFREAAETTKLAGCAGPAGQQPNTPESLRTFLSEDRRQQDRRHAERRQHDERWAKKHLAPPVSLRIFVGAFWALLFTLVCVLVVMGVVFCPEIWAAIRGAL